MCLSCPKLELKVLYFALTVRASSGSVISPTAHSAPRGFPDPNIHSLGRHCEPDPQAHVHVQIARACNIDVGEAAFAFKKG
jgi:hypothetical protein